MNDNGPVGAVTSAERGLPAEAERQVAVVARPEVPPDAARVAETHGLSEQPDLPLKVRQASLDGREAAERAEARLVLKVERRVDGIEPATEGGVLTLDGDDAGLKAVDAIIGAGRDHEDTDRDERGDGDGSQGGEGDAHGTIVSRHGNVGKDGQIADEAELDRWYERELAAVLLEATRRPRRRTRAGVRS